MSKKRMVFALLDELATHFAQLQDAVVVVVSAAVNCSVVSPTYCCWCLAAIRPPCCNANRTCPF